MIKFILNLGKNKPDIRLSSMERDSFIHSVEKYLETRPDIIYNDSVKEKLVNWFTEHKDYKIKEYLGIKS